METKAPVLKCRAENQVRIRVWTSARNQQFTGAGVGHVSIEIPGIQVPKSNTDPNSEKTNFYASLWPTEAGKESGLGIFQPIDHEYKVDYQADFKAEKNRTPEVTVCLYSLNIRQIERQFTQKKDQIQGWALIGGNKLINQNSAESCASLAYELLKAGGIYELISSTYFSKYSSVVSPDALVEALFAAKRYELEHFEETQGFVFAEETPVPEGSWCVIS